MAEHSEPSLLKIAEIAERQGIPAKFLEAILNQLKSGGFVRSQRGVEGGYSLARPAEQITVGEVIRFMEGSVAPFDGTRRPLSGEPERPGIWAFKQFWEQLRQVVSEVADHTTFADLVQRDRSRQQEQEPFVANWSI